MALMPVAEALQRVLADARALPAETVKLNDALGRVLTENVVALRTQPPAAVSAMDGYAVRAADLATTPVTLTVTGEVAAGRPFAGQIGHRKGDVADHRHLPEAFRHPAEIDDVRGAGGRVRTLVRHQSSTVRLSNEV